MRHYEIVLMIHPDQSEQVDGMVNRYRASIERDGGIVHRHEDWGRRQLAYPIKKVHKAHYVLLNIEVTQEGLAELESALRFNDAILRNLILARKEAETGDSKIYQVTKAQQAAEKERERRREEELANRQKVREEEAAREAEDAQQDEAESGEEATTEETAQSEDDKATDSSSDEADANPVKAEAAEAEGEEEIPAVDEPPTESEEEKT